ncbi:phosphonate transport system ATP-binding protein [Tranquillimonas alkanivorans]|uniref:Phosphonate transport system ATP-binding protein n=2 Tax=Tranquillimonas alkanivorans TaxID=441119 RepID=A0A1I5M4R5_9RHOB|nr:phosphonate transport system ATP-binding protein [Tranquillimonas alkanivorans]
MDGAAPMARIDGETLAWQGKPVLRDVRLELRAGERLVLLGRSGAGKSTLIGALRERLETGRGGPRVALVPQDHGLVPQLSVHLNAWMGRLDDHGTAYNLANLVRPFARERRAVAPWLDRVGLAGLDRRAVETLSGGQRQRTALARALFRGGDVALADEPVSAVDPAHGAALLDALGERFPTVVLALHDTAAALRLASRVVGLRGGGVAFDKSVAEISDDEIAALYRR